MNFKNSKPIWINPLRFIGLFVIAALIYLPLNHFGGSLAVHNGSIPLLTLLTLLTVVLSVSMLIYMVKEQRKHATLKYSTKHRIWSVPLGILSVLLLSFIGGLIIVATHAPLISFNQRMLMSIGKTKIGSIYLLIMLMFSPTIEEFFCRFMIVGPNPIDNHKVNKFVYGLRIIIGIALFSLIHILHQLFTTTPLVYTLIDDLPYFISACVLTYFYVHTQDIRVSIGIHTIWDLLSFILIFM